MGTKSRIIFREHGKDICHVYRQYDGYPEGRGLDLKEFLEGKQLVNGFGANDAGKAFNGIGCLAASWIKHEKDGIGNVYIEAISDDPFCIGEEYAYIVDESLKIKVIHYSEPNKEYALEELL